MHKKFSFEEKHYSMGKIVSFISFNTSVDKNIIFKYSLQLVVTRDSFRGFFLKKNFKLLRLENKLFGNSWDNSS